MYKSTRRYGLQSIVFANNPWALIRTTVKAVNPQAARREALAALDQAEQFFRSGVEAQLLGAKPVLLLLVPQLG